VRGEEEVDLHRAGQRGSGLGWGKLTSDAKQKSSGSHTLRTHSSIGYSILRCERGFARKPAVSGLSTCSSAGAVRYFSYVGGPNRGTLWPSSSQHSH
jgi:hypothetical protein